jgi:hypothetical protein
LNEPPTRVLLVARFDDAMHAHSALRRRALERLGCQVDNFDPSARGGMLARFRGGSVADRLRDTIAKTTPELILVTGEVVDVGTV